MTQQFTVRAGTEATVAKRKRLFEGKNLERMKKMSDIIHTDNINWYLHETHTETYVQIHIYVFFRSARWILTVIKAERPVSPSCKKKKEKKRIPVNKRKISADSHPTNISVSGSGVGRRRRHAASRYKALRLCAKS